MLAEDITDREALLDQLRHQAFHDSLTGLPNRALLVDRLSVMLERIGRTGSKAAVLFCDLDGFKPINDSLGHAVGDELLRQTARRFAQNLRAADTLARLGGDEFVIVCEVDDEAGAVQLAQRLGASLIQPMDLKGHEVRVSTSIGIAIAGEPGARADELVRNADIAMYRAKDRGRGEIEVFASGMHGRAVQRLRLEQDLRPAMGRGEFELYYQPLVGAADHELTGFEALMRWNHPTRGLIPPGEFIEIAEDSGFIVTLGAWALGEACRQLAEWSALRAQLPDEREPLGAAACRPGSGRLHPLHPGRHWDPARLAPARDHGERPDVQAGVLDDDARGHQGAWGWGHDR